MADAELLWRWANDSETRRNAFNTAPIVYADHVAWLTQRLASRETRIWVFTDGDEPVGQVRFDLAGEVAEIDISVAPGRRDRGYGTAMLNEAVRRLRTEADRVRPRATVFEHNLPSLRLFKACGFTEAGTVERGDGRAILLELAVRPPGDQGS